MKNAGLLALGLGLTVAFVACGGDDSDDGASGSSGTSGSGGSTGGCDPVNGDNECPAYVDCAEQNCMAEYKQCLGDDFMSGTFGGPCADYMNCVVPCNCDTDCTQACYPKMQGACQDCMTGPLASCITSNCMDELQACQGGSTGGTGGGGTTGGGCDDLKACCDSLTGADQTQCQSTYDQIKAGGDAACGTLLQTYQASGKC
jgi:hypothetical protein